jgi:rubrerythrin
MIDGYSQDIITLFLEIARGTQRNGGPAVIHKWHQNILVQVRGYPTDEDLQVLQQVLQELNSLLTGISIIWSDASPNTIIYFEHPAKFSSIESHYTPPFTAFYWSNWNTQTIRQSTILIACEGITQNKRNHHIYAMLMRVLGLINRKSQDPDSIFYQGESETNFYTDIDRTFVQMLYLPTLHHNMSIANAQSVLSTELNKQSVTTYRPIDKKKTQALFCMVCGEKLEPGDQICPACGTIFDNKS